jgi:hypothetical protein
MPFLSYSAGDTVINQNPLVLGTTYTTVENLVPADNISAPDLSRTLMNVYGIQTEAYFNSTAVLDQIVSSSGVFNLQSTGVAPMNFSFASGVSTSTGVDFMERNISGVAHYVRLEPGVARMHYANTMGHGRIIVNVPRIKLAERQLARALSLYTEDGSEYVCITYNWTNHTYSLTASKLNNDGITSTVVSLNNGGAGYFTMVDMLVALYGSALGSSLNLTNNRLDIIVLEPTFYIPSAGTYYIKISPSGNFYCDTAIPLATEMGLYSLVIATGTPWTCVATDLRNLYTPGTVYSNAITNMSSTSASVYNTNVTNLSIGGSATSISIGTNSGTINFQSPTLVSTTTLSLFNTLSTTVNAFGDGTAITMGASTGTFTINNPNIIGATTLNLFNTVSTTVNTFGSATGITMGASTGTFTIRNAVLTLTNATTININGTSPTISTTSTGTATVFNTNILTANAFGSANVITIGGGNTNSLIFNMANNITASGYTKTINIGTGGVSGSTTNINLGSTNAGILTINSSQVQLGSTARSVYAGSPPVSAQGLGIDWGHATVGETDLINAQQTGTGGFNFYKNSNSSAYTLLATLDGSGNFTATQLYNAVWNDIADFIEVEKETKIEFGKTYIYEKGKHAISSKYAQKGIVGIASDTLGFGVGKKSEETPQIPIAIGGFVLAYIDKIYSSGTPLTCSKNGSLTKMKLIARLVHPERAVATFYKTERNKQWNGVEVKGRSWVKIS